MEMKKTVLAVIAAVSLAFLVALMRPATSLTINDTDTATVSIDVSSLAIVDITPVALSWTGAQPAKIAPCDSTLVYCYDAAGTARYGIEIENMGSVNITHIWLNTTFESSYPFATGSPTSYDAGNFIAVSKTNSTSRASYLFVNRVEYNATKWPIYLKLPSGTVSSGRLRDGNYEWFWALVPAGSGLCNETGATIYMSDYTSVAGIHNETQNGDIDLSDGTPAGLSIATLPADNTFGYANVTLTTPEGSMSYVLLVPSDCSYVAMNHWNIDWAEMTGAYAEYVWDQATDGYLTPGNLTEIYVQARVPYGVHFGSLKQGVLTVLSTAQ